MVDVRGDEVAFSGGLNCAWGGFEEGAKGFGGEMVGVSRGKGSVPDVAVTGAELELLSVESLPRFSFRESGEEQGGGIIDASGSGTVLIRESADPILFRRKSLRSPRPQSKRRLRAGVGHLSYNNRSGSKLFE
jgi:hypothetical protein